MKKSLFCFKLIVSGLLALVILSLFSTVYYNPPVAISQPERITNHRFETNKFFSFMLEGCGYGVTDSLGYNNTFYNNLTNPDIVFVGSSQLEALQVPHDSNFVYLLNEKFVNDNIDNNDYKCLNLGISGHFFNISVSNFEHIAKKYKDSKCIIVEINNVEYDTKQIEKMLNNEYSSYLEQKSFIYNFCQKIPYFRLLFKKISELDQEPTVTAAEKNEVQKNTLVEYQEGMNEVLRKMSDISTKYGVKTILLFHNRIVFNSEKQLEYEKDKTYIELFEKCCIENNIEFIDVTPNFISKFKNEYKMPYGYMNTVPGGGHLNKTGHKIISEELYKRINNIKEELNSGI